MRDFFLIYLHGFNSSPLSKKAQQTRAYFEKRGLGGNLVIPDLAVEPAQAIADVQRLIETPRQQPVVLAGSSLGGYYATWLAEHYGLRAALINPAVNPHERWAEHLGMQQNYYTGETYELTTAHIDQLRALECERLHPENYLLLVQTGDEVLDYRQAVEKYAGSARIIQQGGDHSFQNYEAMLPLILDFLAGHPIDAGLLS